MRRRLFTLVEVMVSLSLLALLLSGLLFSFRAFSSSKERLEEARWALKEQSYLQFRLEQLFGAVVDDVALRMEREELSFSFDNGVQRDPLLSHKIRGRLFLDRARGMLFLEWLPLEEAKPSVLLPLLDGVTELSFAFHGKEGWVSHWTSPEPPALLRLLIARGGESETYAFRLPSGYTMRLG